MTAGRTDREMLRPRERVSGGPQTGAREKTHSFHKGRFTGSSVPDCVHAVSLSLRTS